MSPKHNLHVQCTCTSHHVYLHVVLSTLSTTCNNSHLYSQRSLVSEIHVRVQQLLKSQYILLTVHTIKMSTAAINNRVLHDQAMTDLAAILGCHFFKKHHSTILVGELRYTCGTPRITCLHLTNTCIILPLRILTQHHQA